MVGYKVKYLEVKCHDIEKLPFKWHREDSMPLCTLGDRTMMSQLLDLHRGIYYIFSNVLCENFQTNKLEKEKKTSKEK